MIDIKLAASKMVTLQSFIREMLDAEMQLFASSLTPDITEIVTYYYSLGGKKLRPALFLAVANAFKANENLAPHALALELIHTMSLYHDDVIDEAKERRGAPTVHEKWNKATAIVGGDIFHAAIHGHLLSAIKEKRLKHPDLMLKFLLDLISNVEIQIGSAVIKEMKLSEMDGMPSLEDAIDVSARKTAPLFAFSAKAGAYLAEQDSVIVEDMYEMGWRLGYAFQLIDDLGDYFTSDKDFGGDLREDKKTPFLVLCHQKNPSLVNKYRKRAHQFTLLEALTYLQNFKDEAIMVLNWISKEISAAKIYLDKLDPNNGKDQVFAIIKFMEIRMEEINLKINNIT